MPDGSSTEAGVAFAPEGEGTWATKLLIDTNDREIPTSTVLLRGESEWSW